MHKQKQTASLNIQFQNKTSLPGKLKEFNWGKMRVYVFFSVELADEIEFLTLCKRQTPFH